MCGFNEENSIPGPTDVQYKGYFVCDDALVKELRDKYLWSEVKINIHSDNMDVEALNNITWYYSKLFNQEVISVQYMGRIYFYSYFFWFDVITK